MAIECAYCGGTHDNPRQVRECWTEQGSPDVGIADDQSAQQDLSATPGRLPDTAPTMPDTLPLDERAVAGPGPDVLGRSVVLAPGQDPPAPWSAAERLRLDGSVLADPRAALRHLRIARAERRRLVIELAADLPIEPASTIDVAPYEVGPRFEFLLDELAHQVWSNSVDAREPGRPVWHVLDLAVAGGATPCRDAQVGDVVTAAGEAVWLDGGPPGTHPPVDGVPVLHSTSVEHRCFDVPLDNATDASLAPDQLAAVTHPGGSARIVAPAGSGKTRVLTERARHLLRRWRVPAGAVSLVAFNKRAQIEMTERTADLPGLQVRTLNSIALAIINGTPPFAARSGRYGTITEPEVRRVIGDLVSFPRRRNADPIAPWIEALSLIRLGMVDPEEAERRYDGEVEGLASTWPVYRQRLERQGVVDFDGQIYRALEVLLTDPAARRAAQRACRFMLVDEFQDLTPAHLLLVRLLAGSGGSVFGVGDDDQTIYGYNGADPAWLIDFADLFPGSGDHPLTVNYRCPAGIVDGVDRLLRHNHRRVAKVITAASSAPGGWAVDGAVDAVGATVGHVQAAIDDGAAPADIAVLTRVNALVAPVQVALVERGVPVSGGVGTEFLDRTAVRAVLAWLRLAGAAAAERGFAADDVLEALRRPSRSFHPRVSSWIAEQRDLAGLYGLADRLRNERDSDRLREFADDIATLRRAVLGGAPTSDLVLTLVDTIGLAGSVSTLDATRRGMNRAAQGDDLTAITHLAALHDDSRGFEAWLRAALSVRRADDGVVLSTVHRVKGQEWPHVVVHMAAADQYPHRLAEDVEEERRLLHVAITRAAQQATIVTGPSASPFVEELTREPDAEGRREVTLHEAAPHRGSGKRRTPGRTPASASGVDDLDDAERERYAALVELRNQLRDGKPAYTVFDNKTLVAIARRTPTTHAEMRKISGVGPAKLERYGDVVTELMRRLTADGTA